MYVPVYEEEEEEDINETVKEDKTELKIEEETETMTKEVKKKETKNRVIKDTTVMISKFNFVDLAGSERIKRTGAQGNNKCNPFPFQTHLSFQSFYIAKH